MTKSAFVTTLRSLTRRKPFRPFSVELVNGSRFRVDHPEAIALLREEVVVYVGPGPDSQMEIFDRESVCQFITPASDGPE